MEQKIHATIHFVGKQSAKTPMTVRELIGKLQGLPVFMQELPVKVQDGLDPSDAGDVKRFVHVTHRGPEYVEIESQ